MMYANKNVLIITWKRRSHVNMDTSMEGQWVKAKYGSYAWTRTHEVSDFCNHFLFYLSKVALVD